MKTILVPEKLVNDMLNYFTKCRGRSILEQEMHATFARGLSLVKSFSRLDPDAKEDIKSLLLSKEQIEKIKEEVVQIGKLKASLQYITDPKNKDTLQLISRLTTS